MALVTRRTPPQKGRRRAFLFENPISPRSDPTRAVFLRRFGTRRRLRSRFSRSAVARRHRHRHAYLVDGWQVALRPGAGAGAARGRRQQVCCDFGTRGGVLSIDFPVARAAGARRRLLFPVATISNPRSPPSHPCYPFFGRRSTCSVMKCVSSRRSTTPTASSSSASAPSLVRDIGLMAWLVCEFGGRTVADPCCV